MPSRAAQRRARGNRGREVMISCWVGRFRTVRTAGGQGEAQGRLHPRGGTVVVYRNEVRKTNGKPRRIAGLSPGGPVIESSNTPPLLLVLALPSHLTGDSH